MFNTDPQNARRAVSAISAIQAAVTQGQRVYEITSANVDTVLPKLNISNLAKQEIAIGLSAGKHVITHDNQIPGR